MEGGVSPPVVMQVEPEDPDIGDPVGAARPFTASCDQPATMRVYLNGTLPHTSDPDVWEGSYTFPGAPPGHSTGISRAQTNVF